MYIGLKGPERRVMDTDIVKGVVGLDRQKFALANAAKKKVHVCQGRPGTLSSGMASCVQGPAGPCVIPWTAHWVVFCPLMCAPLIANATCCPHRDMEWPDWADKALVYTEYGIVGKSEMRDESEYHAILWDGFDVSNEGEAKGIKVLQYDAPRKCQPSYCCSRTDNMNEDGFTTTRVEIGSSWDIDPLTCYLQFGLLLFPCCERVFCQPEGDDASGLYHLYVDSKHLTRESGDNGETFATGRIRLIGLAPNAGMVVEGIRAAAAAYQPPAAKVMEMERDHKMQVRGCTIM